ncbi:Twinkle protein, mitochondrial [Smittium culicis]|uniref:Twinkle protein, mitochondrial n=1 Tax=Smittium culicis TaxID=133412 RepID=A0A1R1XVL9_9FUNG|nr:Twinkle protein, mitochondrial [Smittium culicis]OMJ18589.1 Twinkle protein, mitochondrial [Smittium culicis]
MLLSKICSKAFLDSPVALKLLRSSPVNPIHSFLTSSSRAHIHHDKKYKKPTYSEFKTKKSISTVSPYIRAKAVGSPGFEIQDPVKYDNYKYNNAEISTSVISAKENGRNVLHSQDNHDNSPEFKSITDNEVSCDHKTVPIKIANEMKNLFILTKQYPRPGLKKSELQVKCPSCSVGKPLKSSYCAVLDVESLEFTCNSCFETGSWEEYQYIASKKLVPSNSDAKKKKVDPSYFKRESEKFELNHKECTEIVESNHKRLLDNPSMLKKLIGTKKNQLRLLPSTIEKYKVGLVEISSDEFPINKNSFPGGIVNSKNIEDNETSSNSKQTTSLNSSEIDINAELNTNCIVQNDKKCYSFHVSSLKMDISQIISNNVDDSSIEFTPTAIKVYDEKFKLVKTILLDLASNSNQPINYNTNITQMGVDNNNISGFFGLDTVPLDSNSVILTGDELDAMAAYQTTGIPSIALPNSTLQLPVNLLTALERFEKIYIWLEDSFIGREASVTIANKLGTDRCLVIHNRNLIQSVPKNVKSKPLTLLTFSENSEDIISKEKILQSAKPIQHQKIVTFDRLYNSICYELMNPDLIKGVPSQLLQDFNNTIKGLRPGELTIYSGPTGSGKTTILSSLSLDFCKQNVPTLWGSFEIPNTRLASRMLTQFAGVPLNSDQNMIQKYATSFQNLPLYFLKFHGSTDPDIVMQTMRHAVYAYDVKHIIIDNLQFMMSMQHFSNNNGMKTGDKYEAQDMAIANFRKFATDEHVHISIVVHTRKEQAGTQLDLNSIFGSAKVTQEADNVIMLQKSGRLSSNKRYLEILKNR